LTPHQLAGTPVVTGAAVEPRLQGQPWTSERRIRERAARRRARNDDGGAMNEGTRALRRRQRFARGGTAGDAPGLPGVPRALERELDEARPTRQ